MDTYRSDRSDPPGRGSRKGNFTDRSDNGSPTTRNQPTGTGRWNKNIHDGDDDDDDDERERKKRETEE